MSDLAPFVPWEELPALMDWRQGEHVSLIGPTGCGKTRLGLRLVEHRTATSAAWHSVAIGTKPKDSTLAQLVRRRESRWLKVTAWPPPPGARRVVLWPRWRSSRDDARQREVIAEAIEGMFSTGGWCLFADEVSYLARMLGLTRELEHVWQQGRSLGLSLVAATQRPAWVPRALYSEAAHVFLWRLSDDEDRRRVSGIGGAPSATVRSVIATLPRYTALYVNARTGHLYTTRSP